MKRLQAIRLRLYPTQAQEHQFLRIAGCCRLVYNLGLAQRRDFWRQYKAMTGSSISCFGQRNELVELKKLPEAAFLNEVPSHCLQSALGDLDKAYDRFFKGLAGYPQPRRKGENDAFTFPDPLQIALDPKAGLIVLPKFGKRRGDGGAVRARYHRPVQGKVKRVTVSRDGGHWYASILVETKAKMPQLPAVTPDDIVGIDRGVKAPFVTSDRRVFGMTVEDRVKRSKQRRLQKALARTRRGSRRREKARMRLVAHKARMARRRRDAIHKATTAIAKNHRVVAIEKLRVQAMTASARGTLEAPGSNVAQKAGLNRSILDKGWGEFRRQLGYKLAWRGGMLIEVPARDTSRTCACCGHVDADSRPNRDVFACVVCGHVDDADINAAKEIRRRGLVALGPRDSAGTVGAARGALCAGKVSKREEQNEGNFAEASASA